MIQVARRMAGWINSAMRIYCATKLIAEIDKYPFLSFSHMKQVDGMSLTVKTHLK